MLTGYIPLCCIENNMALASGYVQGCCDFSPEQVRPNSGFFSIKEQTENDDQIQYMYVKEEKFFWIAQNWQRKKKKFEKIFWCSS